MTINLDDVNKIWYVADSCHYLVNVPICDNLSYRTSLAVAKDIKERVDSVETAKYITEAFYGPDEADEVEKILKGLVH